MYRRYYEKEGNLFVSNEKKPVQGFYPGQHSKADAVVYAAVYGLQRTAGALQHH